jgi:hypothetical protein
VVLCSTVAPVILLPDTATQSASVQLAIDFAQNMSCISARTVIFGCGDTASADFTKARMSLGAAKVVARVDAPEKSTVNWNCSVVTEIAAPEASEAVTLKDPPLALALVDLPVAAVTWSESVICINSN